MSFNNFLPDEVKLKSTDDIFKNINNEYELLGKAKEIKDSLYRKWHDFEKARRSWFKNFIQDFLEDDFYHVLRNKYPNILDAFRLAEDALDKAKKEFDSRILEENKRKVV